ncbi:helix-turn-helix transcriptional regulator [Dysgonomonas sp. BGC7]|uniref:S24 family peptidase n=1 Tax=Dysgonomonas sp. BGC7 TaxID=1658008 RepID=UPI000680E47E|nr:S24 family peptidase [Dysgonomonas sp. BGC7]MBD8388240.1 hypothetical protein [Dysgonomonas sp. BGC7]
MSEMTTQKDRIILYLESRGISKNKFYTQTGVSNGTLDKKSGITGDTITKIYKAYPDINLEWLIMGEGEMVKNSQFAIHHDLNLVREQYAELTNIDPDSISNDYLIRVESPFEFIPIFSYKDMQYFQGYISIPNLGTCDGAGYVKTDSMYPTLKPGDIVCFKVSRKEDVIHWGEMYLVHIRLEGEEYLTIKKIVRSALGDDYVCLTGCNKNYHDKDVPLKSIGWRALIKAHVSYNSLF